MVWLWLVWCGLALAEPIPAIEAPVTDVAGVLTPGAEEALSKKLVDHRDATGVQMAVVVVRSTDGATIEDYARQTANQWGGGSVSRADGVLYVLAIDDHTMRLEVGRDLRQNLPDKAARVILDRSKPQLKRSDYAGAAHVVVDGVVAQTAGLAPADLWYGALGNRVTEAYLGTFTLGGVFGALWLVAWRRGGRAARIANWGVWLVTPLALGVAFFEGSGFWWAYPGVYYSAVFSGAFLWFLGGFNVIVGLAGALLLHVLIPIHLVVDLAADPIVYPRGIDVFTLLEYHYKLFGFLIIAAPILLLILARMGQGAAYGSGGSCGGGSPISFGILFGAGGASAVRPPTRRKVGGPAASKQSWKGGGKRKGWFTRATSRAKDRFDGGGASSSW